jgi:membrane-bound ClpP family serine protease
VAVEGAAAQAVAAKEDIMRATAVVGLVLMVLGLAAFAYQGINYTTRETVIDIGPVHATAERHRTLPLPPVVGGVAVVGGIVLLVAGMRKHA